MTRRVTLHPAPHLRLPGNTDCNSPCFWNARGLHLFTSAQAPSLTSGPSLDRLLHPHAVRMLDDEPRRWWIEAVHLAPDGRLFALYHREDYARLCPDRRWFTISLKTNRATFTLCVLRHRPKEVPHFRRRDVL